MKYMGSKRFMLKNGLGSLLTEHVPKATRVVDPFCGAGSVIQYVAKISDKEIIAGDLQKYAVVMANAVIGRTVSIDAEELKKAWIDKAVPKLAKSKRYAQAIHVDTEHSGRVGRWVRESRALCAESSGAGTVWRAYGGHYYSPKQALTIDQLRKTLPSKNRDVCLAALIIAASRCAAAPGHTAQPFQPTKGARKFIKIAWKMDILKACETALKEIAPLHAKTKGKAYVSDAKKLLSKVKKGDLVIVDPPYSGVQYSRFYHVLETIARGKCGDVSGVGRYPVLKERPQSKFSNAGQSLKALEDLMSTLAGKEATVIFTFPRWACSNGLSGDKVMEIAEKWFDIDGGSRIHEHVVVGKFSTMGGNNKQKLKNDRVKTSRVTSEELLLLLKPRVKKRRAAAFRVAVPATQVV